MSTAKDLLKLIAQRHTNDVFVPECKDGATLFGPHFRLDAWAMRRSWSNFGTVGYEIKVSRSDFLRDTKIIKYLDLCNQLFLVCDHGVCDASEIPDEIGLMTVSKTGSRLFIKKQSPPRDIPVKWEMLAYILMSRSLIRDPYIDPSLSGYWERWLEKKEIDHNFGIYVRGQIRKRFEQEVESVRKENRELKRENEGLAEIGEALKSIGIDYRDIPRWDIQKSLEDSILKAKHGFTRENLWLVKHLIGDLQEFQKELANKGIA